MRALGFLLLAGTTALPAAAQVASTPDAAPAVEPVQTEADDGEDAPDLVVTGARAPGSVAGDIPPEQQLSPADIRSYGVGSVQELLAELAPQTRSGRGSGGAPVVDGVGLIGPPGGRCRWRCGPRRGRCPRAGRSRRAAARAGR